MLGLLDLSEGHTVDGAELLKESITVADDLLSRTPRLYDARYRRARALLGLGKAEEGLEEYRRAAAISALPGVVGPEIMLLGHVSGAIRRDDADAAIEILSAAP